MPQITPTLGMKTYDLVNDGGVNFSTWRIDLAGYTNSALTKIDAFATQTLADINLLKSNPPIVRIPAIKTDDFSYAVTGITEITEYRNGMYINLSLNSTNLGTISLNINNLGSKGVYKIGTDGLVANMSAGDLKLNKMYLFRYNGTAWVWVNAVTSDQLNVVGTVGNLTKISTNNTLEDAGVTFSNTTTNNALAQRTASGQIKGVTPVDNDDLVNKTYADTKAPINSPTLTGTPLAPTATIGTNTTQIATTAFVNSEIDNDRPYGIITSTLTNGGTGVIGTSTKVAREDHTHTMPTSVLQSQVINDLTTGGETNVLSAQQGVELSSAIGQLSNPVLNINPDFQVWQRGTSFNVNSTQIVYTADRWCVNTDASALVTKDTSGGLKVTSNSGGTFINVIQKLEDDFVSKIIGKKVTLTVEFESGIELINVIGFTDILNTNNIFSNVKNGNKMSVTFTPTVANKNYLYIQMIPNISNQGRSFVVKYAKLELGEIATPLSPRPYGEELALCQRYFRRLYGRSTANAIFPNQILLLLDDLTQMRIVPTLKTPTESVEFIVYAVINGINQTGFSLSLGDRCLIATKNAHGLTNAGIIFSDICLDSEIY